MNLSNDYMLVLDEIRLAKKVSIADLCQDIITERTYYRMLKTQGVRTDVFSKLATKLGVDLSEFVHYAVFVRKNDSRFKFIYRVHTKFYRDIEEHYQAIIQYHDPSEELDLLLRVYIKKYEYEVGKIDCDTYHLYLKSLIEKVKSNQTFNIYLFTVMLIIQKDLKESNLVPLKQMALDLYKEEFSYSVILVAICYDELLDMLMRDHDENDYVIQLVDKYEKMIAYFPSRYFLMRFNLYKAYLGHISQDQTMIDNYLYKFLMNALSMIEEEEYIKQVDIIKEVFKVDSTNFLYDKTKEILI